MLFNYKKFEEEIEKIQSDYNNRHPFPYAVFDDLFDVKSLENINSEITQANFALDERNLLDEEVKIRSDFEDNEALPPETRRVFEVINGGKFLSLVSKLTGIDGLISDPYYDGGGVNIIKDNGTLAVHVDGTHQHRMSVARRINAILFLNEDWNPDWNGYHEQWVFKNSKLSPFDEEQSWQCVRKILPKQNRLYIFITNDHSWHGHAGVLKVPPGVERRSLITYYYTNERPESDVIYGSPHRALFIKNDKTLKDAAFADVDIIL